MKIALSKAEWAQHVPIANGEFSKSLAPSKERGISLWFVGHGVLIEIKGKPDRLVPIGNVLAVEAAESVSVEEWAGGPAQPKLVAVAPVASVAVAPAKMSEEPTPVEPKKKPFGRK